MGVMIVATKGYRVLMKKAASSRILKRRVLMRMSPFMQARRWIHVGLVASGGRVLAVTALSSDQEAARAKAYQAIKSISWDDGFYRTDIAKS